MLQYKELLAVCIDALNNFNSNSQSVEDYVKGYLKLQKVFYKFYLKCAIKLFKCLILGCD